MDNPSEVKNILPCDGKVLYFPDFLKEDYLEQLIQQVEWQSTTIKMFGKEILEPRLTAWYAGLTVKYTYSNSTRTPTPWTPLLLELKKKVEEKSGHEFNGLLLNYYRDGSDYMGWHSDNEKELGLEPIIASLSFGEERNFQFKHKERNDLQVITIQPKTGSLIIMKGSTQANWKHRISKTSKMMGPRVNLTFRFISV